MQLLWCIQQFPQEKCEESDKMTKQNFAYILMVASPN